MRYEKRCKHSYECCGECWMNVAGNYAVWNIISKQCKGTEKEKKLIEGIFNNCKSPSALFHIYDFTNREKLIISGTPWAI